MNKNKVLVENAKRLYVVEQMTINEIANICKVNERTIRRWKEEGKWDLDREQYLKTKSMFHEELYNFARKLMTSIEYDLDNGNEVNSSRMYTFTKMLPLITKIKDYEENIKKETESKETEGITPDFVQLIETEILGMKPKNEK